MTGNLSGSYDLRQGEALACIAELGDATVDAVVTDPPYSSGGFTRGDRASATGTKYVRSDTARQLADFAGDNRDQRAYAYWCALWLSECLRVTKPGGVCLLFTDWRQLPATTDALQAGGWIWRGVVPWSKVNARPQAGRFAAQCEYVVWGSAGSMGSDYSEARLPGFYSALPPRIRDHQTQKPLDVMRSLVQIAPKGGVILDPFMGSGTTGVAALMEGRKFIGCEKVDQHFATAQRRIQTVEQGYRDDGAQMVMGMDGDAA